MGNEQGNGTFEQENDARAGKMNQHNRNSLSDWKDMAAKLPQGWEKCVDPKTGKTYYKDHVNCVTSWDPPINVANTSNSSSVSIQERENRDIAAKAAMERIKSKQVKKAGISDEKIQRNLEFALKLQEEKQVQAEKLMAILPSTGSLSDIAPDENRSVNNTMSEEYQGATKFELRQQLLSSVKETVKLQEEYKKAVAQGAETSEILNQLLISAEETNSLTAAVKGYEPNKNSSLPKINQNSSSSKVEIKNGEIVSKLPKKVLGLEEAISVLYSNPKDSLETSLRIIRAILTNIISKPGEGQYRRLKIASKPIQTLLQIKGSIDILRICGFTHDEEYAYLDESIPVKNLEDCLYYLNQNI